MSMKSKVFLNEWTIRVHLFCDLCKIMNNTYFYKVAGCMSLILFFLKFCECFFPYENFEGNRIFISIWLKFCVGLDVHLVYMPNFT